MPTQLCCPDGSTLGKALGAAAVLVERSKAPSRSLELNVPSWSLATQKIRRLGVTKKGASIYWKPWFFRGPWHGGVLGGQNVWWPLTCCKLGFLVSYALQVGFSLFVWVAVFSSFVAWWPASTCLAAPCADGILTEPCMEGRGKLFHLPLRCVQSRLWGLKFDVCSICLVPAVSGRHLGGCYMLHSCLTPPAPCLWNTPPKAGGCRWKHMKTPPKTIT